MLQVSNILNARALNSLYKQTDWNNTEADGFYAKMCWKTKETSTQRQCNTRQVTNRVQFLSRFLLSLSLLPFVSFLGPSLVLHWLWPLVPPVFQYVCIYKSLASFYSAQSASKSHWMLKHSECLSLSDETAVYSLFICALLILTSHFKQYASFTWQ